MRTTSILAGAAVMAISATALAVPEVYFGFDNGFPDTPFGNRQRLNTFPNSTGAQTNFLNQLISDEVVNFEAPGYALNAVNPAVNFPVNGITATMTGGVIRNSFSSGGINDPAADGPLTGPRGRYATSGEQYLNADSSSLTLAFNQPIAAFGFFGIDIGDFEGTLSLHLTNGGVMTLPLMIPAVPGGSLRNGSVIFFGFIERDPSMQVTMVEFRNSAFGQPGSVNDIFAFDDFTIGGLGDVCTDCPVIPLPSAMGLGLAGFLGVGSIAGARRRR